ncbi:type VI secretion system baseplate subunit TssG [Bordetella sp. N]|uniref:type VI secretion system baseplate subunit TssG n=1 Tax=Bordetella sp. N TaxID=1746199 RepID=UPI0018D1FBF9|nr:type VI secretion system baseplate subunit TssG [Bordetella sp. N]
MPPMQRRRDTGVIESLLAEPQRYKFFQAVRLLERWFQKRQGEGRSRDVVAGNMQFLNSPSLGFPASEIADAQAYDREGNPLADAQAIKTAVAQGDVARVALTPAFFGLLGGQGALPLHYSETLALRESLSRDRGARAFFDIFANRAAALFYGAWKKYRLPLRHESDRDHHYLPLLLALGGLGHPALRDRLRTGGGAVYDESMAHYAAAMRQRPVSGTYLQQVLCDYFGQTLRVEQFVGKWYTVPPERRTSLGSPGAVLGVSAFAGDRIWQRDLRMRIWIGPLSGDVFADFLPGGERARALEKMLTMLAGVSFEYEVRLILAKEAVSGSSLGGATASAQEEGAQEGAGARLGWNTFLCSVAATEDRDDASYELQTIH